MPKRIWLVGTGPSLNRTPLELLKDEDSMSLNRIDLFYHKTAWRPTHYFCMDIVEGSDYWKQSVLANPQAKLFLWDEWKGDVDGDVTWISRCQKHHFYASDNHDKRVESWHLPTVCTAFGSMSPMMQLAVLLGYEEIYLLGCDMWKEGVNHMTTNYVVKEDVERRNRDNLYLHQVAQRSCPIPIYNATVGGELEVHPRVDMLKVLNG